MFYKNKSSNRIPKKSKNKNKTPLPKLNILPIVTIQLPVYNEMYVIERLIDAVAKFNYPIDKLEIQVLDDSTDETVEIIAKKVKEWQEKGLDIKQVNRTERIGFKAGALDYGMKECKGEYIAIFDADFVPTPDFLIETIPYFQDKKIGVVQTRWEHINKEYSLLTRLQAFALDAHFSVEQGGRNFGNRNCKSFIQIDRSSRTNAPLLWSFSAKIETNHRTFS